MSEFNVRFFQTDSKTVLFKSAFNLLLTLGLFITITVAQATEAQSLTPYRELSEYKKGETWDFSDAELKWVIFSEADLTHTIFSNTKLIDCTFDDSTFKHSTFEGAQLDNCLFRNVIFDQCKLNIRQIWSSEFSDCKFRSLTFWKPDTPAHHIDFVRTSFEAVDFSHHDLSEFDLEECNFDTIKIDYGKLPRKLPFQSPSTFESMTGAIWLNLSETEKEVWRTAGGITDKSELSKSLRNGNSYRHIDFHSAKLRDCDFREVDFSGYMLNHASLDESNLEEATFHKTHLVGTDFDNATLRNADFRNADLWGADFSGADLTGATFEGADIENANFTNAKGEPKEGLENLKKRSNYAWNKLKNKAETVINSILLIIAVLGWFVALGQSIYIFVKKKGSPYKELIGVALAIHILSFLFLITFAYGSGLVILLLFLGTGLLGLFICLIAWLTEKFRKKSSFNYFLWTYVSLILYCPGMIFYYYLVALLSSI